MTPLVAFYVAAAFSAFFTVLATLPLWRRWCLRVGLVDDPGARKIHDQPLPLAGGLAVTTGLLCPILLAAIMLLGQGHPAENSHPAAGDSTLNAHALYLLHYGLNRRLIELVAILIGALGMLVVGFVDDKHELRPGPKFVAQVIVAAMVAASGVRITLFVPNLVFSYAITILWILALVNAFNFMDNMNGLCAGLGAIGAWYFAIISAGNDQYLVALIAFLVFGALLGFLPWNFPTARVFLGDAGSHLVGYLLAVLAILPHFYTIQHAKRRAVLIPFFVLAVPLFDLGRVVIIRWRAGRPFYVGDTSHLSHYLVRAGLSRTRAVLLIWLSAAVLGALSFLF